MVTEQQTKLLSAKGFDDQFFKNLAHCETHKDAYEMTEQMYQDAFGKRRYKTFQSYRKARDFRMRS
jgi:hypothetical protein